jgi:two-component system sensor histidine kinase DesK
MTGHHDAGTLWKASLTPVRGTAGRGVTATWVYTFVALVFFELIVIVIWTSTFRQAGLDRGAVTAVLFGGLLWVLSTVRLLRAYRHRTGDTTAVHWSGTPLPLAVAVFCGVLGWAPSGLWVLLLLPVAQSLQLLDWPRPIRARMVLGSLPY